MTISRGGNKNPKAVMWLSLWMYRSGLTPCGSPAAAARRRSDSARYWAAADGCSRVLDSAKKVRSFAHRVVGSAVHLPFDDLAVADDIKSGVRLWYFDISFLL
jgi:hypothetical protein